MKIIKYTIEVNTKTPFKCCHTGDNHICLCDERDDKRKKELSERREKSFAERGKKGTVETLEEMLGIVRNENALLLHTGDLIDFVSQANLDYAKKCLDGIETVMAAGNHEFSLYVGEAKEDEAYKSRSLEAVKNAMPQGIIFGTKDYNGVRFISLDNSYYYILPKLFEKTKEALNCSLPCVLLVHTPLYSKETYEKVMNGKPEDEPPYLCGCPDYLLKKIPEDRFIQQKTDETTDAFIKLCNESKNLKAVLTGHIHEPCFSHLDSGTVQIAVNAGYFGEMNEYEFV